MDPEATDVRQFVGTEFSAGGGAFFSFAFAIGSFFDADNEPLGYLTVGICFSALYAAARYFGRLGAERSTRSRRAVGACLGLLALLNVLALMLWMVYDSMEFTF